MTLSPYASLIRVHHCSSSVSRKMRHVGLIADDEQWCTRIKDAYGDRVIATSCQRTSPSHGVHYLPSVDRVRAGVEVMTDTFLALRADQFVGNGRSNVSAMIAVMKKWAPGDCTLIGRSQLMERNLF